MQAELRYLHCADADPLEEFRPSGDFGIFIQAMIGPQNEVGEESFEFCVCTPEWFAVNMMPTDREPASGRHTLFVRQFHYPSLESYIRGYCASCTGKTWSEVAEKLSRLGHWEFEDYRP